MNAEYLVIFVCLAINVYLSFRLYRLRHQVAILTASIHAMSHDVERVEDDSSDPYKAYVPSKDEHRIMECKEERNYD